MKVINTWIFNQARNYLGRYIPSILFIYQCENDIWYKVEEGRIDKITELEALKFINASKKPFKFPEAEEVIPVMSISHGPQVLKRPVGPLPLVTDLKTGEDAYKNTGRIGVDGDTGAGAGDTGTNIKIENNATNDGQGDNNAGILE